jgi:hypothetical protein
MKRHGLALLISLAALLALAPAAGAVTRYADPNGSGTTCSLATPCKIGPAINGAATGNEIVVASGTYGSLASPVVADLGSTSPVNDLNIHAANPADRPLIYTQGGNGLSIYGEGSRLADVDLIHYGAGNGLYASRSTVSHVSVDVSSIAGVSCLADANYDNTLCVAHGAQAVAFGLGAGAASEISLQKFNYRNVTGWSYAADGLGLSVSTSTGYRIEFTITNSIIHGGANDLVASADGVNNSTTHLILDHSNYVTTSASANDAAITAAGSGTNQTAAPQFVDLIGGDFHAASATSPIVDAGADDVANGTTDLSGVARIQGARTDIGAYESPFTAPVPPPAVTKPTLGSIHFKSKSFRAAHSGSPIALVSKAKPPTGTSATFTTDKAAAVMFTIAKKTAGRKVGSSCVKKTSKNASKKSCSFYNLLHSNVKLSVAAAGTHTFKTTGRWGSKHTPLSSGDYLLSASPSNSAGAGATRTAHFTISK